MSLNYDFKPKEEVLMAHYAVVGGAGFIGSHFIDVLVEEGHEITVVDNLCSGSEARIKHHLDKGNFKFIVSNANNTRNLINAFEGVDTVIHLASNPDIAKAATEPRIDFEQGTVLTEAVLEAARISEVRNFLYASGSGVYSGSGLTPIKEESKLQPISTYGASKLAGESLVSAYSYMFGMKGISFRFANVVGSRQTHGVGFDFLRKLRENPSKLHVLGDGNQTKSYIDVIDVVRGVLTANSLVTSGYEVFNIATLDVISVKEIVSMTLQTLKLDVDKTEVVYQDSDRGWKADVPIIALDSEKLRHLGWKNKLTSTEAMLCALKSMASETY